MNKNNKENDNINAFYENRKSKNIAVLRILLCMVVLFFFITILRMDITGYMSVSLSKKNNNFLTWTLFIAIFMLALSFASVPLYDLFCRVTGYAGTVQRASLAPGSSGQYKNVQIRFDSNISSDLNWEFNAPKKEIIVQPGVQEVIYYTAKNLSDKATTGTAVFNVSPPKAGSIFMKVDCFCFVKQTLQPGEEVKMPVSFYVDPSINDDENTKNMEEITLSYTFFNAET